MATPGLVPNLAPLPHSGRNLVFTNLFNYVKQVPPPVGGTTWKTFSQFLRLWDQVNATDQPAIFLHRQTQTTEQKTFTVAKWHFKASIWVYFRADNLMTQSTYPDMYTDAYLDSFERLFQTDPLDNRLTLNGTVWHCWIDGTIFTEPGVVDGQAIIIIPISILL